jgi:hypothetical protein
MQNLFGEEINEETALPTESVPVGWPEFWEKYPRKADRLDAQKAWRKLKPSASLRSTIMEKLDLLIANNWHGKEMTLIPLPSTFIRGHRWEDAIHKNGNGTNNKPINTPPQNGKYERHVKRAGSGEPATN